MLVRNRSQLDAEGLAVSCGHLIYCWQIYSTAMTTYNGSLGSAHTLMASAVSLTGNWGVSIMYQAKSSPDTNTTDRTEIKTQAQYKTHKNSGQDD